MIPKAHAAFLRSAIERLKTDPRIVAVAAGGSMLTDSMDEYSDLDLVIAVSPAHYDAVLDEREAIAESLGPLLAAFTGEHVGEPRLLICLYGPESLLHVDLKFVSLADAAKRVEDPAILWERDAQLSMAMRADVARFPEPSLQWIEDRFWVWVHYIATKVGRGELLEALDSLSFLRSQVLGPLALTSVGARPSGVRRIELIAPHLAKEVGATVATNDAASCASALASAAAMYQRLREQLAEKGLRRSARAESAAMDYLKEITARLAAPTATANLGSTN